MKRLILFAAIGTLGCAAALGQATSTESSTAQGDAQVAAGIARTRIIEAFADAYSPDVFTREQMGAFAVLPIAESRSWTLTGTRVSALSAGQDADHLRLSISAPGGFSEKVSYFFYIFPRRAAGKENTLTMEIQPRANGSRGACLLWEQDAGTPLLIGTVTTSETSVELDIGPEELASILSKAGEAATIDFTAGWFDRSLGTWEEFYYATFSAADIPATG
jgi:hypothetical protein